MPGRAAAIDAAMRHFDSGAFRRDLADLVSYPTESQNPAAAPELRRYLDEAMEPRLKSLGFNCNIYANPTPGGGPFLIGERHEGDGLPTILTYGHGDVTRGQAEMWREGLDPFRLIEEGDRLFGRGSADNKGQHLINLAALGAVIETRGKLGFNIRILLEMGEEIGSPGLHEFCAAQRDRLAADVLIASDGPRLQPDTPTLFMGSRGGLTFDLVVDLREGARHSGNWGGLLADPAMILAQALSTITDARGQIRIPEWRPDSLTGPVRTALRDLPLDGDGDGPAIDCDWGEAGLTPAERAFGWNSFAILAMTSGVPEAPVNAISASARATCQLRFVVGTDPDALLPSLRQHLDSQGFQKVRVVEAEQGCFAATRTDPTHPWAEFVRASLSRSAGKPPPVLPNLAGSLPNDAFADVLGLPTVWVPHSYRGCCQHAPDEHVLKSLCRDALGTMTGHFWDIGDGAMAPADQPARAASSRVRSRA